MPTYEYACAACGHEWEQTQRITEPPVTACPVCDKATAHRLISAGTNFILKGGGWYSDLYSSPKPSNPSEKKSEKAEANGTASPETKGESKAKPDAAAASSATSDASSGGSSTPSATPGASSVPST